MAGIEGNDATERAWANYIADVSVYIQEAESDISAPIPDRYLTKGQRMERAIQGDGKPVVINRRPDCEFKYVKEDAVTKAVEEAL